MWEPRRLTTLWASTATLPFVTFISEAELLISSAPGALMPYMHGKRAVRISAGTVSIMTQISRSYSLRRSLLASYECPDTEGRIWLLWPHSYAAQAMELRVRSRAGLECLSPFHYAGLALDFPRTHIYSQKVVHLITL
jgi:hypothetical protein